MKNQWNILFLAKEAYSICLDEVCEQFKVNHMELSILLLLTGDPSLNTAQKIVNTYHLSKSHVSTSLNTLEKKGFVKKLNDGQKRKNINLIVVEPGLKIATAARKVLGDLQKMLEHGLSENQIVLLNKSMENIYLNLQQFIQDKQKERD